MSWAVGQELKALVKPEITREQLKQYAAASGDNNPIHLDEAFAKEAGFPSVIVHGMISMAFLADHLLLNFPPETYRLKRLRTRFRKVTFPGDVLTCTGKVKAISPEGVLTLTLTITNQRQELTTDAEASVTP